MKSPLISIILPVYNGENYLDEAIASCIAQTYSNLEIIIVDDASTDRTPEIIESWARKVSSIKVYKNCKNLKLPASLNIGHYEANGDYITWTSDDNRLAPNAIESLYNSLINYSCDIVYSEYMTINENGYPTGYSRLKDIEFLIFYGVIGACFLYKKEVFDRNEGYDEKLFMVEDFDFWLRALNHSTFRKLDNPGLYEYRFHKDSLTDERLRNSEKRKIFFKNLESSYLSFFSGLENKKELIDYLIAYNKKSQRFKLMPLRSWFFKDLNNAIKSYTSISMVKLKRIIMNDVIEYILTNRQAQTTRILIKLHQVFGRQILRLSVERYFAIVKKCIF